MLYYNSPSHDHHYHLIPTPDPPSTHLGDPGRRWCPGIPQPHTAGQQHTQHTADKGHVHKPCTSCLALRCDHNNRPGLPLADSNQAMLLIASRVRWTSLAMPQGLTTPEQPATLHLTD